MQLIEKSIGQHAAFPINVHIRRKYGVIARAKVTHRLQARVRVHVDPVRSPLKDQVIEESGYEAD